MLKPQRHFAWNLTIITILAGLYAGVFLALSSHVNFAGAPFAVAAVIVGGWCFGTRGSALMLLVIGCEGLILFRFTQPGSWTNVMRQLSPGGLVTVVVIGIAVGRMSDLDRKVKQYAEELQHQAFHDPLTGLPNRVLFADRLEHATARVARGTTSLAVLFVDLDDFKQINDRHGHAVGDLLLQAVAKRLEDSLREGDTIARLGGDEYVALLEDLDEIDSARQAASRLAHAVTRPFIIDDGMYTVSASIGVAFCPAGFTRSADLLLEADRAMYEAKAAGNGRFQIARPLVA